MIPSSGPVDGISALRRYGLAIARNGRLASDERSTRALVEGLCNRALLAARNGEGPRHADIRLRLFTLFIRLYRRQLRLATLEDGANDGIANSLAGDAEGKDGGSPTARAVRDLTPELRESLFLVVLEGFSHIDAAQALDIPLATLIDRLTRAREMLAAGLSERTAPSSGCSRRRGGANLRLVK